MVFENDDSMSRRDFLILAGWFASNAAIGCWSGKSKPKTPEKSEYQKVYDIIIKSGYKIDDQLSHEDTGRIIVFLKDAHVNLVQDAQCKKISALDSVINFDGIGFEGLAGRLEDIESIRLAPQNYFDQVNRFDTNKITMGDALVDAVKKARQDTDIRDREKRRALAELYESLFTLQFNVKRNFPKYHSLRTYLSFEHRPGAPGIAYLGAETRADKFGIETKEVDQLAISLRKVYDINAILNWMQEDYDAAVDNIENVRKLCSFPDSTLFDELDSYTKTIGDDLQEMKEFRKKILSDPAVSDELREYVLSGKTEPYSHPRQRLFNQQEKIRGMGQEYFW